MRAVLVHVTEAELAHRRSAGLDRRDEMWEGVLHMTPAPSVEHQRILDELVIFLGRRLATSGRGVLRSGISIFRGPTDYRVPDLTFVSAGRERLFHEDGVRGGGPDAVVEIRSPEDETYDKLPFFAAIGTREVIVIDRDTKRPEIYRLAGPGHAPVQPDAEGWVLSETMRVRFRVAGQPPRLHLADMLDPAAHAEI
jgi:Uma2 family endonuclease